MAAQQNDMYQDKSRKNRGSKKVAFASETNINEETNSSGNTFNDNVESLNSESKNRLSKGKVKELQTEARSCANEKTQSGLLINSTTNEKLREGHLDNTNCQGKRAIIESKVNPLNSTDNILTKSKKRRLRKQKSQLVKVESTSELKGALISNNNDDKIRSKSKSTNVKSTGNSASKTLQGSRTDLTQIVKECPKLPLLTATGGNSGLTSLKKGLFADSSILPSSSNSINKKTNKISHTSETADGSNSFEESPSVDEEQEDSAQTLEHILLNMMKTLNVNDMFSQGPSGSSQSKADLPVVANANCNCISAESQKDVVNKMEEIRENVKFAEKYLDIAFEKYLTGNVGGGGNSAKRDSTLQVDHSSDMLQVNDKSKTADTQRTTVDTELKVKNMASTSDFQSAKSREEVLAQREAAKAAKLAKKKAKAAGTTSQGDNTVEKVSDTVDGCLPVKKSHIPGDIIKEVVKPIGEKQPPLTPTAPDAIVKIEGNKSTNIKEETSGKTKAELKAERRLKQEAQRAAKAALKENKQPINDNEEAEKKIEVILKQVEEKEEKCQVLEPKYKVKLFSHLCVEKDLHLDNFSNLHPAILQLGAQYKSRVISGSNARCLALLHTLKKIVTDFSTPMKQEFSRGLESLLVKSMNYLNYCRPASVSMTNVIRHIKRHLTQLPNSITDSEARHKLQDIIDTYIREQIDVAGEAICNTVQKKINNGDVILTYGCSSLICRILTESHRSGTKFSVVVVDSGPWFEGREMLRRLVNEGLTCSYSLLTAASFIMREASKVLLGAHALLANGYVMSRAGTSQVAMLAHSHNVPVLVCCETHKFSERVQTDAFVCNELGDPDELISSIPGAAADWRAYNCLSPLSIAFDVTPADLVTAVVTELGILPCTSVPVILRIKPSESV